MAFGESSHLEECILSLLAQKTASKLIITTSTPSVKIDNLSEKYGIPLKVNPVKGGIAADWNYALDSADTKYATLAHQDDVYLDVYTDSCIALAEMKKDTQIVFTDYYENRGVITGGGLKLFVKKLLLLPFYLNKSGYRSSIIKKFVLLFGCPVCCPSVFYNKENLPDFRFEHKYRINLDWDAWIRMAEMKGRFQYCKERAVVHRIHRDSETSKSLEQRKSEDREIFDRLWFFPVSGIISLIYRFSYSSFKK